MESALPTKKRILYVGYDLVSTRAPHQAMAAIWLALNGHHVTYLATGSQAPPRWIENLPELRYVQFRGSRHRASLSLLRYLFRALRRKNTDYLYCQGAQQSVLCTWVPLVFPNIPLIYHTQDFKPRITPLYSAAEGFLARRSQLVICNEINRAKVMQVVHRLSHTPEVIRTSLPAHWPVPSREDEVRKVILRHVPENLRSQATLISVGGPYMSRRNSRELVQSLRFLNESFCLVFTGMPPDSRQTRECLELAEDEGVSHRIVLLPRLDYDQLLSIYAACDLGVLLYSDTDLANFYQGPGRVTEYLRAGIPFVTSDFPGLDLLVRKYQVGIAANPRAPADIARALRTLQPNSLIAQQKTSKRLQAIASTNLAYEKGAESVLGNIFATDMRYASHPLWNVLARRSQLLRRATFDRLSPER